MSEATDRVPDRHLEDAYRMLNLYADAAHENLGRVPPWVDAGKFAIRAELQRREYAEGT